MKQVYKITNTNNVSFEGGLIIDISNEKLSITSSGKTFDFTPESLKERADHTSYPRYFFVFETFFNDGKKFAKFNGEIFNLYKRTRRTKQNGKDYSISYGVALEINIALKPEAKDFSDIFIGFHSLPDDNVIVNGAEAKEVTIEEFRVLEADYEPKFKIEGSSTIKVGDKETYTISYEPDNSADFKVKFNANIGIINKQSTNLINGKTSVTIDASDLTAGETIQLDVGTYEFTNTTNIKIQVI